MRVWGPGIRHPGSGFGFSAVFNGSAPLVDGLGFGGEGLGFRTTHISQLGVTWCCSGVTHTHKKAKSGMRDAGSVFGFGFSALLSGSGGLVDGLEFRGLEFRAWGSGVLRFEDPGSRIRVLADGS